MAKTNDWVVRFSKRSDAEMRLLCCPYAGGGGHLFRDWAADAAPWLEVLGANPPGRGTRFGEPLVPRIEQLVPELARAFLPFLDQPYAVFGHSMGSILAFELTRYLRRQGLPGPKAIFLSSRAAPGRPPSRPPIHALPESEFVAQIGRYGGCPPELLADDELMRLFSPVLRADFTACETHVYAEEAPLTCPITALFADGDPFVCQADVEPWALQTSAGFRSRGFVGDHFYLRDRSTGLVAFICETLRPFRAEHSRPEPSRSAVIEPPQSA